jgi:hypothetical protein
MKASLLAVFCVCAIATVSAAVSTPNFTGTWVFNAAQSKNIGMMASAQITSTIKQTRMKLTVVDDTTMGDQKQSHETDYDLSGKRVANESPMGEHSQTSSKWSGNKLITTWETEGAVAGTKVIRIEKRYLSGDGKTMFLESARGNNPSMIIAFDRE